MNMFLQEECASHPYWAAEWIHLKHVKEKLVRSMFSWNSSCRSSTQEQSTIISSRSKETAQNWNTRRSVKKKAKSPLTKKRLCRSSRKPNSADRFEMYNRRAKRLFLFLTNVVNEIARLQHASFVKMRIRSLGLKSKQLSWGPTVDSFKVAQV